MGQQVAGGEQDSTGGPIPLSAGRREQPCHVDTKQSPTPAMAARVPSKSLGHSLGEISRDVLNLEKVAFVPTGRGLQVHPCGVEGGAVQETLLPSAGGPAGPSHPEGQQLLLGTEGDASSTQPQRVVWGETERQQAVLEEQAGNPSRKCVPEASLGQASEEQAQCSKSTLEWGLPHSRDEARGGTPSSHHRLTGPQADMQKQLKTLGEEETETGGKKNDVKTRLPQLENVFGLLRKKQIQGRTVCLVSPHSQNARLHSLPSLTTDPMHILL